MGIRKWHVCIKQNGWMIMINICYNVIDSFIRGHGRFDIMKFGY